jgi:chemotaxis protein CheX
MKNFEMESRAGCLIIHCNADLVGSRSEELSKLFLVSVDHANPPAIVLNMKSVREADQGLVAALVPMSRKLKAAKRPLYVMNVSDNIRAFLRDNNVDHTFRVIREIEEALREVSVGKNKFDAHIIGPFVDGTVKTLKIQCGVEAKAGKPEIKKTNYRLDVAITAVIGLVSSAFSGSIAICFPEKIFLGIMGNMFGEKFDTITKELEDGATELLNIIFGQAKRTLNEKGYAIEQAIPTIVRGHALEVWHLTPQATIVIPFETVFGSFAIEIATEGEKKNV